MSDKTRDLRHGEKRMALPAGRSLQLGRAGVSIPPAGRGPDRGTNTDERRHAVNRPTDHYILRDIDNRDDGGAPYETRPTTLADLANYVDGPLLSDLTDPSNADEVRSIAAEMREGRLSDESHARLRGLSVYIRKAVES